MRLVSLVPVGTKVNFLRFRQIGMGLSLVLCLASAVLFMTKGLNYGIDFQGGILVEGDTLKGLLDDGVSLLPTEWI